MKRAVILSAIIGLASGSAGAQETPYDSLEAIAIDPVNSFPVFLEGETNHIYSSELKHEIRRAFERSREIELMETRVDSARVLAPARVTVTNKPRGPQVQVTYEVAMPRSDTTTHTASCSARELDYCVRGVVMGTERLIREYKRRY